MNVEVKTITPMRLFAIRHVGPYHEIGASFGKLFGMLGQSGINAQGSLGIFHDEPGTRPDAELRSDACAVVAPEFTWDGTVEEATNAGDLHIVNTPEDEYAVFTYVGAYDGLGAAWQEASQWPMQNGYDFDQGIWFERYVDDCNTTPVEQLRTEICIPVKKAVAPV